MDELPLAPASCTLDSSELGEQLSRYRLVGLGARVVHDGPQQLVIRVDDEVADSVIEELLTVERSCCPFFKMEWGARSRHLSIGVSRLEDAPALEALRYALRAPFSTR
jgi:hypothetical protein